MLPEKISRFIGQPIGGVRIFEVEKGGIRKFADAVEDRNPLYWDDEFARNSPYGAIIAPPGFFGWPMKWEAGRTFPPTFETNEGPGVALDELGYSRTLDGGMEYEFYRPVRVGDRLAVITILKDIVTREGKTGKMAFLILETTYTNQNGDVVARARATHIRR